MEAGGKVHIQPRVIAEIPESQMAQMHPSRMESRVASSKLKAQGRKT
jgi:hypothetical protein